VKKHEETMPTYLARKVSLLQKTWEVNNTWWTRIWQNI